MKIAVTYEEGRVFQHFGHSKQFKVYDVDAGVVSGAEVIDAPGEGHGALAGFLKEQGVQALICGGIGGGARQALMQAGIELYPGVNASADECVQALLAGTLDYHPDTVCAHHHHEHSSEGCHAHGSCGNAER